MSKTNLVAGWPPSEPPMPDPTISQLEAKVAEANARVAEAAVEWAHCYEHEASSTERALSSREQLRIASQAQQSALSALEAARRPRLLSAEEAVAAYHRELLVPPMATGLAYDSSGGMQAVLTASMQRACAVIEATAKNLKDGFAEAGEDRRIHYQTGVEALLVEARKALLPGGGG